jgi:DNA repair protein RecN (Recombination protein N)
VLDELRIAGLGVIDEAVLPLDRGLTVLTGETGAGKTMLVTALLLLFGSRADAARVRAGNAQASVDGRLSGIDTAAAARVREAGGQLDDGDLLLRRVVSAAGRSRAVVGGAPAPVAVLAELADGLVAVHGQSDQLRLARPAQQLAALDRFAAVDVEDYRSAFLEWRAACDRLAERTVRARELRREADLLEHGIKEIAAAAPEPGEDRTLAAEASRLAHVDGLRLAARAAHDALVGDPDDLSGEVGDAASLLSSARRELSAQSGADSELDHLGERLAGLVAAAVDLGADLGAYRDSLDADPGRLAEVEARRAVLSGLVRRYGEDLDAVLAWSQQAQHRLSELDVSDEALAALTAARDTAAVRCGALAEQLTAARTAAATTLSAAVTAELSGLAMADASVAVLVSPRAASSAGAVLSVRGAEVGAGPDGVDDVEILLQPHPDSAQLPLSRGASGGELSRVMLALEVCLADSAPVPTMIFDEVDSGVGGRAAVEVGRRLARLAHSHQVIVVTHLAQVAAYADQHIVIDKPDGQRGVVRSDVRVVEGEARTAELARMLAGTDSSTARVHAAELLASARAETSPTPSSRKVRKSRDRPS